MEDIKEVNCLRCGYIWIPNKPEPKQCARCHSTYWNIPIKNRKRVWDHLKPAAITSSQIIEEQTSLAKPEEI